MVQKIPSIIRYLLILHSYDCVRYLTIYLQHRKLPLTADEKKILSKQKKADKYAPPTKSNVRLLCLLDLTSFLINVSLLRITTTQTAIPTLRQTNTMNKATTNKQLP